MGEYNQLLNEIDGLLGDIGVLKSGTIWDQLASDYKDLLLGSWDQAQKNAINDVISIFYKNGPSDKVTDQDVQDAISAVETSLGKNIPAAINDQLKTLTVETYEAGQKSVLGYKASFNVTDEKAIAWLHKDSTYWIGSHYDRQLSEEMQTAAAQIIQEGMNRDQATKLFTGLFQEQHGQSANYYSGLANHVVTRGREFGSVEGYVKGGITKLKVLAFIDNRTSDICKEMDGRIIEVSKAVKLRDSLINSEKPEKAKAIAPWVKVGQVRGKKSKDLSVGMSLPPYHFRCFPAGTMISTGGGDLPIEDVKLGNLVYGQSGTLRDVTKLYKRQYDGDLIVINFDDSQIKCTPNHPIWVEGYGWKAAKNVGIGDELCLKKKCLMCSSIFEVFPSRSQIKYCSPECRNKARVIASQKHHDEGTRKTYARVDVSPVDSVGRSQIFLNDLQTMVGDCFVVKRVKRGAQ